jgi:hypothetical protein
MSKRRDRRRTVERPDRERPDGAERPARASGPARAQRPDRSGRPARAERPDRGGILRDIAILVAAFAIGVGAAELLGAANLGVAFGIAQIVFSIVLVGLLLWT